MPKPLPPNSFPKLFDASAALSKDPLSGDLESNRFVPDTVAAPLIGSTPATLRRWRHEGRHLRYYKVGSSVRYDVADLDEFMAGRAIETRTHKPCGGRAQVQSKTNEQ